MPRRFVLFDFDGVIADSHWLAYETARTVHPHLTEAEHLSFFEGNIFTNYDHSRCTPECRPSPDDFYALYTPRIGEIQLIAGAKQFIEDLARRYTLVIVSSSISMDIMSLLERNDIAKHFDDVFGKDVHNSKIEKIRMIFERYEISAADCVFVTDTLGDMREAEETGVAAIGVTWGFQERETLEKGDPFTLVQKPAELPQAIDDFFESMNA